MVISRAIGEGEPSCILPGTTSDCEDCRKVWFGKLADAIEAEQIADIFKPMPEGIEWPKFEDGELVRFGDKFDHVEGYRNIPVEGITFSANGWVDVFQEGGICQPLRPGETVKRPEPEVLDADGAPINVGDTVYYIGSGYGSVVKEVSTNRELMPNGAVLMDSANGKDGWFNVDYLTHRKPDTQEDIDKDCMLDSKDYCEKRGIVERDADVDDATLLKLHILDLLRRQRKLLGGE